MLERVDGLVGVEAREACLALGLGLRVNGRKSQEVILVTEPPDSPYIQKRSL